MDSVFDVYLAHSDAPGEAYAMLTLPAYPYAVKDALEKARLEDGDEPYMQIRTYHRCGILHLFNIEINGLQELNVLAGKLAELTNQELKKFEGLVMMEKQQADPLQDVPFTVEQLYNLAASVDAAKLIYVDTDEELGKFYVENGHIPKLSALPKLALEMLDYDKIGYTRRVLEGGVFLDGGHSYVVRTGDTKQAFAAVSMMLPETDYTVLMEICVPNSDEPKLVRFPTSVGQMDAALNHAPPRSWRCVDCRVPQLMNYLSDAMGLDEVNSAANMLRTIPDADLPTYKALLQGRPCHSLGEAMWLAERLDEYLLTAKYSTPAELAKDELGLLLEQRAAETLLPFVDLNAYGKKLIEQYDMALTEYGVIQRRDGRPLLSYGEENTPSQDGMRMEGF